MAYFLPILLCALALFQVTVIPVLPLVGIRVDVVLLTIMAWTMVRGSEEGAVGAFAGGIALDVLSTFPLGSHAAALLLIVVPIGWLGELSRGNVLFPIAGAFVATLFYRAILLGLAQILGQGPSWGTTLWRIGLPLALLEAILMPLAYWVIEFLDRRLRRGARVA